jgi:RNA polymerase sigma factor (sigma-70 family)
MIDGRKSDHESGDVAPSVLAQSPAELRARADWLGRHIMPHELMLRRWLQARDLAGLDLEDVVQETYSRILTLATVDQITKPRTYMFQVASSILLDHVRRLKVVSIDAVPDIEEVAEMVDEVSPEGIVAARDDLRRLARDLAALPERVAEVFRLRRIEGLSQRETALRLGITESTVEKHMARGVVMMADWFGVGGYARSASSNDRNLRLSRRDDS